MLLIDFIIPTLVFGTFSTVSVVGAFLIVRRYRGTGRALLAATGALTFFALLFVGLLLVLRSAPHGL